MTARGWAAFAAVSVLWGLPYLLIKIVVDDGMPPTFLAWSRVVIGAAVLIAFSWYAGTLPALRGRGRWLVAFTVFEIALPFPLIAFGEQHVSSSLTAIVIASAPLFVALLALRFDATERVGGSRLAGLAIGLLGVVALVGVDLGGSSEELVGVAAILAAAVCYAIGPMLFKRHLSDLDAGATMAACLALASVFLLPAAAFRPPAEMPSGTALAALLALGLLCTALGLVLYGVLVTEAGAGRALVVTYVNPLVAVGLGVAILDERPGPGAFVGLALILVGSWLATGGGVTPVRRALVSLRAGAR
jgi:drug/metabolite transporter (DMT)-like permease